MTNSAIDRTIARNKKLDDRFVEWLKDYLQKEPTSLLDFRTIKQQLDRSGEYFIKCHILSNRFRYGSLVKRAVEDTPHGRAG